MTLIAKTPCRFGDKDFKIGEVIPSELVLNPKKQENLGVIAIAGAEGINVSKASNSSTQPLTDKTSINIPIKGDKGFSELSVSYKAVKEAFSILQMTADEAKAKVSTVKDDEVLILLNAADKRKGVATAVVARHEELAKGGDKDGNEGV